MEEGEEDGVDDGEDWKNILISRQAKTGEQNVLIYKDGAPSRQLLRYTATCIDDVSVEATVSYQFRYD